MAKIIDGKGNIVVWSGSEIAQEWLRRARGDGLEYWVIAPKDDRLIVFEQTGSYWQYAGTITLYDSYGKDRCYLFCVGGRMFKSYVAGGVRRVKEKVWVSVKGFLTGTYGEHTTMIATLQLDEREAPQQTNGKLPEWTDDDGGMQDE